MLHRAGQIITDKPARLPNNLYVTGLTGTIQFWHRRVVFCDHLITLSPRANISAGIVRPICFAVLRLIASSNLVGCSTGRSAGLAQTRKPLGACPIVLGISEVSLLLLAPWGWA